ncbi:family 1 glycosylhydrolase [Pseudonocardia nigra]|uniref:family 1 glycosylhydrolase n=1 Tax=Pseudonocardia nigra TaxID=1921578 RepID=UPI001C5E667C|nr:family 1 glycosylhydrolase [Pseudonocardia nigra]
MAAADQAPRHEDAARLLDLLINRSALDVLVDGRYPAELLDWHARIGGAGFIQDGDLADVGEPLDYFDPNYYAPLHVLADDPGVGGDIVPPGIGIRQADPVDAPKTSFNWLIDPEPLLPLGVDRMAADRSAV